MVSKQGDLSLLATPEAQTLLRGTIPAQLAYVWTDGTPRVIPTGFHWNGQEVVLGTPLGAPKLKALQKNPKVALSISTQEFPAKVLMIRGTAAVTIEDGIVPEYVAACNSYLGEEATNGWVAQLGQLGMQQMARVAIRPEWVGMLDFQQRFPSALERLMETASAGAE